MPKPKLKSQAPRKQLRRASPSEDEDIVEIPLCSTGEPTFLNGAPLHCATYLLLKNESFSSCNIPELQATALGGSPTAVATLLLIARECISVLERLADEQSFPLELFAREHSSWPVLTSLNPSREKQVREMLSKLHLGAATKRRFEALSLGLKMSPKKRWALALLEMLESISWSWPWAQSLFTNQGKAPRDTDTGADLTEAGRWRAFAREIVSQNANWPFPTIRLSSLLIYQCIHLPRFSFEERVLTQWSKVARDLLLLNTDGAPECNEELAEIGRCRAGHYSALNEKGELNSRSVSSNVRAKIYSELDEEFGRIAKKLEVRERRMRQR